MLLALIEATAAQLTQVKQCGTMIVALDRCNVPSLLNALQLFQPKAKMFSNMGECIAITVSRKRTALRLFLVQQLCDVR